METITTEAWVLRKGSAGETAPASLTREEFSFPGLTEHEALVEPLYGSWEANMTHALERSPVDVCRLRHEDRVVLGNAGVVRVVETGPHVSRVKAGDLCVLAPTAEWDRYGYMLKVLGYDAPHSVGLLAKQTKLHERQLVPLPRGTRHTLRQWAAFSVRYYTAWSNWKVALGCWRLQVSEEEEPAPFVWGWGGGTAFAELTLASHFGCRVAMISSLEPRLDLIRESGLKPIDRRAFPDLSYDEARYETDRQYKKLYLRSERAFLDLVEQETGGQGVSIFIDNLGTPVLRATLRALGRQGVVTTIGWKHGMAVQTNRAAECTNRHIHVHTHGARLSEEDAVMSFAEEKGWVAPESDEVYMWDEIPLLAEAYANGKISSYFPIFQVNVE